MTARLAVAAAPPASALINGLIAASTASISLAGSNLRGADEIRYGRMVKERFDFDLLDFYARHTFAIRSSKRYEPRHRTSFWLPVTRPDIRLAVRLSAFYWDAINQLLESAYELMEQETLNAPFLTK